MPEKAVNRLILRLYEAGMSTALWPEVLCEVRDVSNSQFVSVYFQSRQGGVIDLQADTGMYPDWANLYLQHYARLNPFFHASLNTPRHRIGHFEPGSALVDYDAVRRTEFFNDFMEPMGWKYTDGCCLFRDGETLANFGVCRGPDQGESSAEEISLLQSLMPHLAQAFRIRGRLHQLEQHRAALSDAIDRLAAGVVLLDDRGVVIHANVASRLIIDQRDGLELTRDQKISSGRSDVRVSIDRLVGSALLTSQGKGVSHGGNLAVPRPSGKRPYQLVVTPLAFEGAENVSRRPFVAVFVTDPEREPRLPEESLVDQYGLTPAESGIAVRLVTGRELSDIADELQITMNTARTHVKRILLKTDTRRQTQLISLLLRGAIELRQ